MHGTRRGHGLGPELRYHTVPPGRPRTGSVGTSLHPLQAATDVCSRLGLGGTFPQARFSGSEADSQGGQPRAGGHRAGGGTPAQGSLLHALGTESQQGVSEPKLALRAHRAGRREVLTFKMCPSVGARGRVWRGN